MKKYDLKFLKVAEITKNIAVLIEQVTEDFAGQVEISTFENTLSVICREHFRPDLIQLFNDTKLDFTVSYNGNNSAKFMINLGAENV